MSKHTPKPWFREGLTVYAVNERGRNRFSARVQHEFSGAFSEELEANADLMKEAPAMREALEHYRRDHDGQAWDDSAGRQNNCNCPTCQEAREILARLEKEAR